MRWQTPFLYLIGDRQAMFDVAADRHTLKIGFLFVLSAGFAREYDGEDLVHEPWHVLVPLAASVLASFGLYLVAHGFAFTGTRHLPPELLHGYGSFLGLFWMTAPLAWLYAVPYERFLSPLDATRANLFTLGVVAVWRVVLMMRVLGVLMGYGARAIFVVMAFADGLLLLTISLLPFPLVEIMGGVRLAPEEQLLHDTAAFLCFWGFVSLPVWAIGTMVAWSRVLENKPQWPALHETPPQPDRTLTVLAVGSVLIWLLILPFTQPEQVRRRQVERLMMDGEIAAGLRLMSEHSQSDFPPHWNPPPFERYGRDQPDLSAMMAAIEAEPPAEWVLLIYTKKSENRGRKRSTFTAVVIGDDAGPKP